MDDSLTIYQSYDCLVLSTICCINEIVEFLSELFYGYYKNKEVQRLLGLSFQEKYRESIPIECIQRQ